MKLCPACSREYGDERDVCPQDGASLVHLDTGAGESPEALVGQVVDGRYRVERIVGRGGMGTVYACRQVIVGKAFAMKVLRPGIERSEEILQRFIREAQTANTIASRHICQMIDFGQLRGRGGAFYVVMDLLEGMSFTKALREGLLDRPAIERIFVQIAETLEKAHTTGIIHRDLKPDNVMLVEEEGDPWFVKLVDFGIAKAMQSQAGDLTETGVILGTPFYMSPEQARGERVDGRSDIYALGVMMYRAFTGKLPFVADSAMGVLTRHLTEEPEAPSSIREIEPALEQLILRCLAKHPDDRFQRMADVAAAIRGLRHAASWSHPMAAPAPRAPFSSSVPQGGAFLGSETPTALPHNRSGEHTAPSLVAHVSTRDDGSITALRPDPITPSHPGETNRGLVASPLAPAAPGRAPRFALVGAAAAAFMTIGAIVAIAVVGPDDTTNAPSTPAGVDRSSAAPPPDDALRAEDTDEVDEVDDDEVDDPEAAADAGERSAAGGSDAAPDRVVPTEAPPRPVVAPPPRPVTPPPKPTPDTPKGVDDGVRSPFEDAQ